MVIITIPRGKLYSLMMLLVLISVLVQTLSTNISVQLFHPNRESVKHIHVLMDVVKAPVRQVLIVEMASKNELNNVMTEIQIMTIVVIIIVKIQVLQKEENLQSLSTHLHLFLVSYWTIQLSMNLKSSVLLHQTQKISILRASRLLTLAQGE